MTTRTISTTFKPVGLPSYTFCMTQQDNDMLVQVVLPNGRELDLRSKKGADKFVDTFGTAFISTSLTATDDQELKLAYTLMFAVAENASPEKIASGIPESELRTLVDHTRDTLDTLSTDSEWLRSGTVSIRHDLLLQAVVKFSNHSSFVKIFLSNEGMEALTKCYASRKKNDTPSLCVAQFILKLVVNVVVVLTQEGSSHEKAFDTIEKTGLLGQFIRCVPAVDPEFSADIVECLQTCSQLLKKKLKSGTPTSDILDAVIAGEDGPINEKAKSGLVRLQSLARLSSCGADIDAVKNCRNCLKKETQMDGVLLMKCKKCKVTYYCSKDCQVADWKRHKKMCKVLGSGSVSRSEFKTMDNTTTAFIKSNYFDIAREVYKKTQEYKVPKKELLLEIDFYEDAPALRNEFKVWLTSGFLEGSSIADTPDWFRLVAEKETLTRFLREENEKITSDDLLVLCRGTNGLVSVSSLNLPSLF
jgi:hypothetical protein